MPSARDRISLETPDNITLDFPLASFGQRAVAYLIDLLIYGSILFLIVLILIWLFTNGKFNGFLSTVSIDSEQLIIILASIGGFLIATDAYFALQEFFNKGQTIGKRLLKIRVMRIDGRHITIREALIRGLARIFIDNFPGSFMVGFVSYFSTTYQQRLGDLMAGTVVVSEQYYKSSRPTILADNIEIKVSTDNSDYIKAVKQLLTMYLLKAQKLDVHDRYEYSNQILDKLGIDKSANLVDNENLIYKYLKDTNI